MIVLACEEICLTNFLSASVSKLLMGAVLIYALQGDSILTDLKKSDIARYAVSFFMAVQLLFLFLFCLISLWLFNSYFCFCSAFVHGG